MRCGRAVLHMNPAPAGRHGDLESQLHVLLRAPAQRAGLRMRGKFHLGDESWEKLPLYAAHQVDDLLIVDPSSARSAGWRSKPATIST